jgi:hypothetical protein
LNHSLDLLPQTACPARLILLQAHLSVTSIHALFNRPEGLVQVDNSASIFPSPVLHVPAIPFRLLERPRSAANKNRELMAADAGNIASAQSS